MLTILEAQMKRRYDIQKRKTRCFKNRFAEHITFLNFTSNSYTLKSLFINLLKTYRLH